MTNEQRKAIDKLTNGENIDFATLIRTFKKEGIENFAVVRKEYLDTVLSLIKEQEEEIGNLQKELNEENKRSMILANNDKFKEQVIDLMAEYWNTGLAMCDNCDRIVEKYEKNNCKDCIKQYFADKAKMSQ